jgi:hypothetical protein
LAVAFLLDEHFRGLLFGAIQRHNVTGGRPLDAEQVGDPDDLPLGTLDPDILTWTERNGRIVITHDARTMIADFIAHLAAGRHSPGLFVVRPGCSIGQIVAFLELATYAGDPADYADQVKFIP